MRRLNIDMEDLALAFNNGFDELAYYLDLETGEVLLLSDGCDDLDIDPKELEDASRFLPIPKADSRAAYDDMEAFIETVEDTRVRSQLESVIHRKRPFRQFKDVLLEYPQQRERWFQFSEERQRQRLIEWLNEEDIELI